MSRKLRKDLNEIDSYFDKSEEVDVGESIDVLKNYSTQDWNDWIQDILNYDIAYPISRVGDGEDVLSDIVPYLKDNHISLYPYESALSIAVQQYNSQGHEAFLIRLVRATREISGIRSKNILMEILFNANNWSYLYKEDYVKTEALGALCRSGLLEEQEKEAIDKYLHDTGYELMSFDHEFLGYALRFAYRHLGLGAFFIHFDLIASQPIHQTKRHVSTLANLLWECHQNHRPFFYQYLHQWLLDRAAQFSDIDLAYLRLFYEKIKTHLGKEQVAVRQEGMQVRNSKRNHLIGAKFIMETVLQVPLREPVVPNEAFETIGFLAIQRRGILQELFPRYSEYIYTYYHHIPDFQTSTFIWSHPDESQEIADILDRLSIEQYKDEEKQTFFESFATDPDQVVSEISRGFHIVTS